jgi:peptide/nickel transport system substrate-binding protein
VRPLPFDVEAAKRLLDEAGFVDADGDGVRERGEERLAFAFLAAAQSSKMAKVLPLYLDALAKAGIGARIETVDASAYLARVRAHDFDAIALSWSTPDVEQDVWQNLHSSQAEAGSNYVGFADAEVDALLERIRVEFDPAARHALEREVHRRVHEAQAYLFMGRRPALDAIKRRVQGLSPSLSGYDFATAWVRD